MKNRYLLVVIIMCLTVFVSCKDKEAQTEGLYTAKFDSLAGIDRAKNAVMYEMLSNDLNAILDDSYDREIIGIKKFDIQVDLMYEYLKTVDYKFLSERAFNDRLAKIFKYKRGGVHGNYEHVTPIYIDALDGEYFETPFLSAVIDEYNYDLTVVNNKKFVTQPFCLLQLVDYRNDYPSLALLEDEVNKKRTLEGKGNLDHWFKDMLSDKVRKSIYERIGHYNKYLFNNNRQSFEWLKKNDVDFLENLLFRYGYTEDKELIKWAIDKVRFDVNGDLDKFDKQMDYYNDLFSTIDGQGKLVLSPVLMDVLVSYDQEKHLNDLDIYLANIGGMSSDMYEYDARAFAYFFEIIRRIKGDTDDCVVAIWFKTKVDGKLYDLREEFSKNDYYGYKGLKEFWDRVVEYDKNYVQPVG
ncbi:hypothetical protein [Myroides sp. N17-2]|uniref:hypothetical protein n=1 Tax=Myroides sp. N17-2 TaxID=2030799 RepID=UPI00117E41E6|nr:hypothetical protein [Myroides sp. N17-2]